MSYPGKLKQNNKYVKLANIEIWTSNHQNTVYHADKRLTGNNISKGR